jgi:hypothetical protein
MLSWLMQKIEQRAIAQDRAALAAWLRKQAKGCYHPLALWTTPADAAAAFEAIAEALEDSTARAPVWRRRNAK